MLWVAYVLHGSVRVLTQNECSRRFMQKTRNPFIWILLISIVMGLGHIFSADAVAQKSDKEIRKEYQTSVSQYIRSLDESFAYRYLDNEIVLLDLMSNIRSEYKYRKDKKTFKASTAGKVILPLSRDSIRTKLKAIRDNLDLMKEKNFLMPGYTKQAGLNELHMEYQKLYGMDHELSKLEALGIRNNLIKSGDKDQVRSLLDRQINSAFKRFKEANYIIAAEEFKDILSAYRSYFTEWDDITFYLAESYFRVKDFNNAEVYYFKVVTEFPSSSFVQRSLFNLIVMSYVQTDRNKMQKYFAEFQSKATPNIKNDLEYNQPFYLAGTALFKTSDYTASIAILNKIPNSSRYYYPARYIMANAYANLETYPEAVEQFESVAKVEANNKKVFNIELQKKLKDLALLKIAFIKFELTTNGQKFRTIHPYVKEISTSSDMHDAALLVLSWSALKDNDIDTARVFADSLLRMYPASDYYYEAKTLLGNIQVLDPTLSDKERELLAVDAYNYVAGATEAKTLADQFVAERDSSLKILTLLGEARTIARLRNDSAAYVTYDRLYEALESAMSNNGFMKAISGDTRSTKYYQTMSNLISKIRVAEGKLKNAEDAKNQKEIDKLNKELSGYLTEFQAAGGEKFLGNAGADTSGVIPSEVLSDVETQNYFSLHKVPRSISEIDARNRSMNALKEKMSREKELIQNQLAIIDNMMVTAKEKNREASLIKLQYEREKLADLYYRLSDYEVLLNTEDPIENYVDLDVWGDFASYGRNNITYVINMTKNETIKDLSRAASQIDKILLTRKKNYESRIAAIEQEILLKEQEIRDKELSEMRVSQKQFFDQEYFQGKTTEKPEVDPFDYGDLVPEVVLIPQDTVKQESDQGAAKTEEEEEETAVPAAADTSAKTGTEEIKNETPVETDGAESTSSSAKDSTNNEDGGEQNEEGDFSLLQDSSAMHEVNWKIFNVSKNYAYHSLLKRNYRRYIES